MFRGFAGLAVTASLIAASATFTPARLRTARTAEIPIDAVGGGEVFVELDVSEQGAVTGTTPLRTTPPFTEYVIEAVQDWRFTPAKDGAPVASSVMVAAVFRPPALTGPTLGTRPVDVGRASSSLPVPRDTPMPPFPANAHSSGVVLLEVLVASTGAVENARVVRSAPPFDDAAMKTVRMWHFNAAQRGGVTVSSVAYVMFAFRPPV